MAQFSSRDQVTPGSPRTNPTNRVLVYFRLFLEGRTGEDFRQEALSLIEALEDAEGYTTDELDHARQVLTRLTSAPAPDQ
ncbi:hypothetical protein ACFVU2_19670 [Leifsonia sp. NPDC058194]|uniref:hypothetical protein n=1 Tax=Leifsonia sp. NPDC058194 TaxID=3346374 RepID=UPI0036DB008D